MADEKGDWKLSLSEWRNCPTVNGPSPAQLFYSRQVRSCILPELFQEVDVDSMMLDRKQQERNKRVDRMTRYPVKTFSRDEEVWLQGRMSGRWDIMAWIRGARPHGKCYSVETTSGGLYLRNRRFIKSRKECEEVEVEEKGESCKEGEKTVLTQHEEGAVAAGGHGRPHLYAAVVAAGDRIQRGPVTRSRSKKGGGAP